MQMSLIIPAHARPYLIDRCLRSIAEASRPATLVEVIVVENGGRFGILDVVEKYSRQFQINYEYLETGNSGMARNHGAMVSRGDLLIFIDDDTRVVPQFFTAYTTAVERFGSGRFFGGPLTADYERSPPDWIVPFLPNSARGFEFSNGDDLTITEPAFLGGNMAIPKSLFERAGRFDHTGATGASNSGFVGEETRLQEKMLSLGTTGAYVGDARILHWVPADRCSIEWLLERRRRSGATEAEIDDVDGHLLGFPRWMLRAWLRNSGKIAIARAMGRTEDRFVEPLLQRAYLTGYIGRSVAKRLAR